MDYKEVELRQNQEYRIEVPMGKKLRIMVVAGVADVRGQELLSDRWYVFTSICVSLFTFTGCRMRIDGQCDLQYVVSSAMSPWVFSYFDRVSRAEGLDRPSRIMVLGSGRTTFCITLINYFVRVHKKVRFAEVDPAKGNIFPGVLGSMVVESLIEYGEGFRLNNPHCLFYGATEIENTELYDLQISALKKSMGEGEQHFQVVLAPNLDVAMLNNLVKRLEIDEVVFVGDERLCNKCELVVPKVFVQNSGYLRSLNDVPCSFKKYFHGLANEFSSCTFTVKHDWKIVRIGEEHAAPDSALPLGGTRHVAKTSVNPAELVENSILAISEAEREQDVPTTAVAGFVACLDEKKFKILCPQPRLPKHTYLIQGSLRYVDY
ncbi:polyribonucleotide 5'-hydroxyl-kinase [Pancytospora philotis]|nr:polyribonucleotide 5'-hydroxyl-kinase [Pancytospora philotis]